MSHQPAPHIPRSPARNPSRAPQAATSLPAVVTTGLTVSDRLRDAQRAVTAERIAVKYATRRKAQAARAATTAARRAAHPEAPR